MDIILLFLEFAGFLGRIYWEYPVNLWDLNGDNSQVTTTGWNGMMNPKDVETTSPNDIDYISRYVLFRYFFHVVIRMYVKIYIYIG